eukprot:768413-Hanusia_phi.AAC.3
MTYCDRVSSIKKLTAREGQGDSLHRARRCLHVRPAQLISRIANSNLALLSPRHVDVGWCCLR